MRNSAAFLPNPVTAFPGSVHASSQHFLHALLLGMFMGRQWVGISRVIGPLIGLISVVTLLITLLISTHEPPSTLWPTL